MLRQAAGAEPPWPTSHPLRPYDLQPWLAAERYATSGRPVYREDTHSAPTSTRHRVRLPSRASSPVGCPVGSVCSTLPRTRSAGPRSMACFNVTDPLTIWAWAPYRSSSGATYRRYTGPRDLGSGTREVGRYEGPVSHERRTCSRPSSMWRAGACSGNRPYGGPLHAHRRVG